MTVVLDTNLWVSALVRPQTPPERALDALLQKVFSVSTTEHLWNELLRALTYDVTATNFATILAERESGQEIGPGVAKN